MNMRYELDQLWAQCFTPDKAGANDQSWPASQILAQRMQTGMEADWTAAISHIHAGEALRNKGLCSDALEKYGMAFALTAPAIDLLIYVMLGFASVPDLPAAETWGRRILDQGGDNADVRLHLAVAVWNSGRQREAIALCDANVGNHPAHIGAVATAASFYMALALSSKALDACLGLLALNPDAFTSAPNLYKIVASAAISSDQQLPASLMTKIEVAAMDAAGPTEARDALAMLNLRKTTRLAWASLFDGKAPLPAIIAELSDVSRPRLEQSCNDSPSPEIVSLDDTTAVDRLYPGGLPRPDALEAIGFKLEDYPHDPASPRWVGQDHYNNPATRLQLKVIADCLVSLVSPFGDEVISASSFVAAYHPSKRENGNVIFYFFADPRPLFVIFATEGIWPIAWYDPIREVVLMHATMFEDGFIAYMRQSVRELRYILLHDIPATRAYLAGDRNRRGQPMTLLFGTLAYLSTHILDIQGLQRLRDAFLLKNIAKFVLTAPEPLGSIEDYFPEIPIGAVQRPKLDDVIELNTYLWRSNAVCIRATGSFVGDYIADAVLAHARQRADPTWKLLVDDCSKAADLVVFVALRAASRKWLADPNEIAGMFHALQKDYPRLALVFDGYSTTPHDLFDQNSSIDLKYIGSIVDYLPTSIRVIVTAGRTMDDAIYAANSADMHLSGQGTSATKGLLIASKPGVILSPRQFTIRFEGLRYPKPPTIVLRDQSIDVLDGHVQTDFALDPDLVLCSLKQIAALSRETRGRLTTMATTE